MSAVAAPARRRVALAAAVAALGVLAVLVAVARGGGGGGDRVAQAGPLRWTAPPLAVTPPALPGDRILAGEIRNDSLRGVRVRATTMRVVDADGRALVTAARFLRTFSHALYSPLERPPGADRSTQARLGGEYTVLAGGDRAPLTVSWRTRPGMRPPLTLRYDGGGRLALPAGG